MAVEDVVGYYRSTTMQYRWAWDREHLHYGYWDRTVHSHRRSLVRMLEVMADVGGIRPGDSVLDAGCGVGGSAIWLAKRYGAKVHGITLVPEQAATAERRAH